MKYEFYKKNPEDKIWWVDDNEQVGTHPFSFDKKKVYHLFADSSIVYCEFVINL